MANKKVVVVGAGMAGLAAAYRLRKAGVDPADVFRTRAPETPEGELTAA